MHMPFCTVDKHCERCDKARAHREVKRLREVLRTTMDTLLDCREECKDLTAKYIRYEQELERLAAKIRLVQKGVLSSSDLDVPENPVLEAKLRERLPKTRRY